MQPQEVCCLNLFFIGVAWVIGVSLSAPDDIAVSDHGLMSVRRKELNQRV